MTVDAEPGSEGWQFLCHVRNRWKEVSEEEAAFLDAAWSSGQKSCDYRLKNGVPMKVDFAAKVRLNLASRRATQLRHVDSAKLTCFAPGGSEENEGQRSVEVSVLEPQDGNPGATRCTESSDSEEGDLEIEMLPQPVEILQAEKSRQWLLSESHRERFLRSPRLQGKYTALGETREEQVPMNVYLDACKRHLEDAKVHMEKGKSLYQAEHSEDPAAFESAGKCFALAIDELNKLHALKDLPLEGSSISLQEEHWKLSCGCFLNLAMCNLKACHFQEALENSEEALRLDETSAKAYYRKALALEALGRCALSSWRQAQRLAPQDPQVRQKLRAAVAKLEDQRGWERRAFLGALGDRSSLELQAKADRLRTILSRACEYLSADQLRKGELWRICRTLGSGGSLNDEIHTLDEVFAECVASKAKHKDLELSPDEVSFLSSLGVTLPSPAAAQHAPRARQLVERLQRGEALLAEEEQFLREERRKLAEMATATN